MHRLQFAEYDFAKTGYTQVPPPSLNGGLYSGEPFERNAPWANVPVTPETTFMINENLNRGNVTAPGANYQYPPTRQGNNYVEWKGLSKYEGTALNSGPFNIYCKRCDNDEQKKCFCEDICPKHQTRFCNKQNCVNKKSENYFSKFYYVK